MKLVTEAPPAVRAGRHHFGVRLVPSHDVVENWVVAKAADPVARNPKRLTEPVAEINLSLNRAQGLTLDAFELMRGHERCSERSR